MAKVKKFVHSFSATKKFKQCRRIFHLDRVERRFPFVKGEAAKRGDEIHDALANFIGKSIVIPKKHRELLQEYAVALKSRPGKKHVETKLGVRKDFTPCGYFDADVYMRVIIDYVNVSPDGLKILVVDHKTGKDGYPDVDQLRDNAVVLFAHFPEAEEVHGLLAFLDHDTNAPAEFHREFLEDYQNQVLEDCAEIDVALATGDFPPTKGPLCPWCPHTKCEFWSPPPNRK